MSKQYYWIVAYIETQPYLIYGGESEDEARNKAFEVLASTQFQIRQYPTRNIQSASALFRGKRLEQTKDLRTATRRIKHTTKRRKRR